MARTDADVEAFINDLDSADVATLVSLVAGLDSIATKDGKPVYNGDEITLIGRFEQFVTDYPVDDDDVDSDFEVEVDEDGLEKEGNDENSEDVAGTGETEEEYVARVQAEQNQATVDAAAAEAGEPAQADQNPGWRPSLSDEALAEERRQDPDDSGYTTRC